MKNKYVFSIPENVTELMLLMWIFYIGFMRIYKCYLTKITRFLKSNPLRLLWSNWVLPVLSGFTWSAKRHLKDIFHLAKESKYGFVTQVEVKFWCYLLRFGTFTGIKKEIKPEKNPFTYCQLCLRYLLLIEKLYSFGKWLLSDFHRQNFALSAKGMVNQLGGQLFRSSVQGERSYVCKLKI